MPRKVKRKVKVDDYDRRRRGKREHVNHHTRVQDVNAEGTPTMAALQRPAIRAEAPFVRPMGGAERALNEIAKQWNAKVQSNLGPTYSGVLRDFDWQNPDSAPVVTGDLRDTTNFVILGPDGQPVSHHDVLFENEIQSNLENLEEEEMEERDRTPPGDQDYGDYMQVWEEYEEVGVFDDDIITLREAHRDAALGGAAVQVAQQWKDYGSAMGKAEVLLQPDAKAGDAERVVAMLRDMGYQAEAFAPFNEPRNRGIRITGKVRGR